MVREKDPWDTAKIRVCHWLSMRPGLRKDTRVCQAPAKSSLRNRKCSCVGEYLRPSSSVSLSSASRESKYSFFCGEQGQRWGRAEEKGGGKGPRRKGKTDRVRLMRRRAELRGEESRPRKGRGSGRG